MTDTKALISEELLHQIEEAARAQHRQPAEVLEEAWKQYMEERSWATLMTEGQENARRLGFKESDVDRLIAEYRQENRAH
jgi:predicted transcriptional regulator